MLVNFYRNSVLVLKGAMENGPSKEANELDKMQTSADRSSDLLEVRFSHLEWLMLHEKTA